MKGRYHNKREKLAALLFDLVKYLLTVIGVGTILPESKISAWTLVTGLLLAGVLLALAMVIAPEERN